MSRKLVVLLAFGPLFATSGCYFTCCPPGPVYAPTYGPYNPYAGSCVDEDIWTTPGIGRGANHPGCHCPPPTAHHCDCGAPAFSAHHAASDYHAPVISDCGCPNGGYLPHGFEVGEPQIIYGPTWSEPVPTYAEPRPSGAPPSAPPSSDEYYIPPRSDDFESDSPSSAPDTSRNSTSRLPATLVVPARL